jgi:hypothetical protein
MIYKYASVLLYLFMYFTSLTGATQNSELDLETKMLGIARISGIVYYFNPCKCRNRISEEEMIMSLIQTGNESKNDLEFIANVNKVLSRISCGASLKLKEQPSLQLEKGEGKYRYWKHLGPGTLSLHPPYVSDLMKLTRDSFQYYKNLPQPDSLYCYSITERIDIILPIAVSKKQYNMFLKTNSVKTNKTNKNSLNLLD